MKENFGIYIGLFWAFGMYTYTAIYLYKNRFTYLSEGTSHIPIRMVVGFFWGNIKGFIWPIFLILYFINKSKNK